MVEPLNFKSATSLSLEELAAAFNVAFGGYFYPQQLNGAKLARRVRLEQIDLAHSLLAYQGEEFAGLALLGIRGQHGWCGGFGIVPEHRGHGCAGELMSAFVAEARGCGLTRLSLEVLTRNTPAIRLYQNAGMQVTRDLLILERASIDHDSTSSFALMEAEPAVLLRHFARLHAQPCAWQRDLSSLLATEGVRGFYLGAAQEPEAYALLFTWSDGTTYLIDLAATNDELANALCAGLVQREGRLRIVNEPEQSLFIAALMSHGFVEAERQHEMACELS